MLTVTPEAAALLSDMLEAERLDATQCLRLTVGPDDRLAMGLDTAQDGDQVVQHGGAVVLVIEAALSEALDGYTMGTTETPAGPALTVSR